MAVLIVVFDKGAVSATEVMTSLGDTAELVFALVDTPYNAALGPALAGQATVVPLTGDAGADARRLRALSPSGIVTFAETGLRPAAELAARLGLPFHSPDTALALTDKRRQRRRLHAAGADSVRSEPIGTVADWTAALDRVGLPAVVKPAQGASSRDTHLVADPATAATARAALFDRPEPAADLVAEEFLRGRESLPYGDFVSVESVCGPGGVTHVAITGKFPLEPPFREQGGFWPAVLADGERAEILALVDRSLAALDIRVGITHTEVKLTADGPRIIEVNGRLGGHIHDLAGRSAGLDLVRANALLALNRPVEVPVATPDRVCFQYFFLAPARPCRVTGVRGLRGLRRVPGITAYASLVSAGDELPGGVGTVRLGHLYGEADNHQAMLDTLARALSELSFDFLDAHGHPFTLTRSLPTRLPA